MQNNTDTNKSTVCIESPGYYTTRKGQRARVLIYEDNGNGHEHWLGLIFKGGGRIEVTSWERSGLECLGFVEDDIVAIGENQQ